MALTISTLITDTELKQGVSPLEIGSITVVVNFNDGQGKTYFGGQVTLTAEDDGISFQTTTEDLATLAIAKAKRSIAGAEVFVPKAEPEMNEEPTQSEATSEEPVADTPASEPAQSEVTDKDTLVSETDDGVPTIEE